MILWCVPYLRPPLKRTPHHSSVSLLYSSYKNLHVGHNKDCHMTTRSRGRLMEIMYRCDWKISISFCHIWTWIFPSLIAEYPSEWNLSFKVIWWPSARLLAINTCSNIVAPPSSLQQISKYENSNEKGICITRISRGAKWLKICT